MSENFRRLEIKIEDKPCKTIITHWSDGHVTILFQDRVINPQYRHIVFTKEEWASVVSFIIESEDIEEQIRRWQEGEG